MASLGGVLANIPGLGGYLAAQQNDQQQQLGQLQQIGGLQGILANVQKQQLQQQAAQKQEQLRGVLSQLPPDATPDQVVQAIRPFASADDILKITQGSADRAEQRRHTAELAKQRIAESVRRGDQMFELRRRSETRADRRQLIDEEWKKYRAAAEQELSKYNTGGGNASFVLPPMPQQESAPETLQTTAPNMAAAMQQFAQGGGAPRTVTIDEPQAPPAPQAAPAPVPFGAVPQPAQARAPAAPNNLDARDLRLQNMGPLQSLIPQPTAAPAPAAPTAVPATEMPTFAGSPRQRAEAQNRWLAAQGKASIAGGGVPTKETAAFVARQYLNGNDQALSGYARSVPAKLVIMDAIRTEAEKQGLSPEAVNARIAEFQGIKAASRTIGTRSAGIAMAAEEAQQAIQIVKDTSANFQRTNFIPWNYALKAYDSNTGRPEVVEFGAAINALVNTYARALSPSGIPTVSDKQHARDILSTIQSPAQVDGVLNVINRELEIAKRAPKAVREQIRTDVTGETGTHGSTGGWSIRPR